MGLFSGKKDDAHGADQHENPENGYSRPPAEAPPTYNELQQQQWGGNVDNEKPGYSSNYGPNEYPPEKQTPPYDGSSEYPPEKQGGPSGQGQGAAPPSGYGPQSTVVNQTWSNPTPHFQGGAPQGPCPGQGPPPGTYTVPQNTYLVRPNTVNIASDSGNYTRPEYQEYLKRDQERMAHGDFPKPKEAFRHGAPLDQGHTNQGKSKSGFPGRSGVTYHQAANR